MGDPETFEAMLDAEPQEDLQPEISERVEDMAPPEQPSTGEVGPPPGQNEQQPKDSGYIPRAAYLDERRKRQDVQHRLEQLERQLTQIPAQPKEEPPKPDFWDDPEGYMQSQFTEFQSQLFQQVAERDFTRFADAMEDIGTELQNQHEDADECFNIVAELLPNDEKLQKDILYSHNPAARALQVGRKIKLQREMSDPEKYKERLRAELMAEMGLSGGQESPRQQPQRQSSAPKSLAGTRSAQPRTQTGQFAPVVAEDLLDN